MKAGTSRFEPLAVETVVRDALALSKSTVELSGVEVQTSIPAGLSRVWGDPVQLLQVMVNLVVNGCESMHMTPSATRRLELEVAPLDRDHVEVLVADHGIGLPCSGTWSTPPAVHGLHRSRRQPASRLPRHAPCRCSAVTA